MTLFRVFFDANELVDIARKSNPTKDIIFFGRAMAVAPVESFTSEYVLRECFRVLGNKQKVPGHQMKNSVAWLGFAVSMRFLHVELSYPSKKDVFSLMQYFRNDPDDAPVLADALRVNANYLVTENTKDFAMVPSSLIKVIRAKDMWNIVQKAQIPQPPVP